MGILIIKSDDDDDDENFGDEKMPTTKDDRILGLMMSEHKILKDDIKTIKKCQTSYFWSSITASGAILTYSISKEYTQWSVVLSFISLLIISPMWCLYFDKTSFMVRVLAYIRVLEWMIINFEEGQKLFCGFESYTKLYRTNMYESYKKRKKKCKNSDIMFFITRIFKMINAAFFTNISIFIKSIILIKSNNKYNEISSESGLCKVIKFRMPNQKIYLIWLQYFFISTACFGTTLVNSITKIDDKLFELKYINYSISLEQINFNFLMLSIIIFLFSITYTLYLVRELVDGNRRSISFRELQCRLLLEDALKNPKKLATTLPENYMDKQDIDDIVIDY